MSPVPAELWPAVVPPPPPRRQYETDAQSVETRTALHGVRWPPSNPKKLLVDFASPDELEFHKTRTEHIPRKTEPLKVDPYFATRQQEELRAETVREKRVRRSSGHVKKVRWSSGQEKRVMRSSG